jgi:hypothetical protein
MIGEKRERGRRNGRHKGNMRAQAYIIRNEKAAETIHFFPRLICRHQMSLSGRMIMMMSVNMSKASKVDASAS